MRAAGASKMMRADRWNDLTTPDSCRVYTPPHLADALVGALLRSQACDSPMHWLEPCVGDGVFLQSLSEAGIPPDRIRGIDIYPVPATRDSLARVARNADFLKWALNTSERFGCVVANPPYLALHNAPSAVRLAAASHATPNGTAISGDANLWYAFLCASLRLLDVGGALGFVLPSAWDYARYAEPLRSTIGSLFAHVDVLRSNEPLFNGVLEGSIILIAREYCRQQQHFQRTVYPTATRLVAALHALPAVGKAPPAVTVSTARRALDIGPKVTRLGDVLRVRIGAVTGDARYFLLRESERIAAQLPEAAFCRVVTRARHLRYGSLTRRRWSQLRAEDERIWLFRPPTRLLTHPSVKAYLKQGIDGACSVHNGKVARRPVWYTTPLPVRPHAFLSGMSGHGPWLCINDDTAVSATNTLYVAQFDKRIDPRDYAGWALALQTTQASSAAASVARRYAGGLMKLEPAEVHAVEVPTPKAGVSARNAYRRCVAALLRGDRRGARSIADSWFEALNRAGR